MAESRRSLMLLVIVVVTMRSASTGTGLALVTRTGKGDSIVTSVISEVFLRNRTGIVFTPADHLGQEIGCE
jgi:hypothetical protein